MNRRASALLLGAMGAFLLAAGLGCAGLPGVDLSTLVPDVSSWTNGFEDLFADNSNTTGDDNTADDGNTDDNSSDDGNTDDQQTGGLTIVKTGIAVRHDAGLLCGTDLIAFGTGTAGSSNVGVSYIQPSTHPSAGTPVTDTELYDSSDFAVGGHTIFLVGNNSGALAFQVSVFDATPGSLTKTFTTGEIRLASIPVTQYDLGNIRADGNYCVVICDPGEVTDGKIIKVIDVSSGTPTLVAFDVNPSGNIQQVDVDAATKRVVAASSDTFYVYNIDTPTAAPTEIAAPDGTGAVQMDISGNYLVALNDAGYPQAFLVNLATNALVALTNSEGTYDVAVGGDKFAFFANYDSDDAVGAHQRAAVGTVPGPSFDKAALNHYIDGSYTGNGTIGFAGSMTVVPDGSYVFLANWYLQYSTGGASFTVPADPDHTDTYGTPAWDVASSTKLVGFKTAADRTQNTETKVGYIILP